MQCMNYLTTTKQVPQVFYLNQDKIVESEHPDINPLHSPSFYKKHNHVLSSNRLSAKVELVTLLELMLKEQSISLNLSKILKRQLSIMRLKGLLRIKKLLFRKSNTKNLFQFLDQVKLLKFTRKSQLLSRKLNLLKFQALKNSKLTCLLSLFHKLKKLSIKK